MTQEDKDYAVQLADEEIRFGFSMPDNIVERISDAFEDQDSFDRDWLESYVNSCFSARLEESKSWTRPTGFDRLAEAFDELIKDRIVCLHKAGYTRQDGEDDCLEVIRELQQQGKQPMGFCFYHEQDLARAIDPGIGSLFLSYNSPSFREEEALVVANMIVSALKRRNFNVSWNGSVDERIKILDIDFRKVPDQQDWGMERVLRLFPGVKGKPFWKFW